MLRLSHNLRLTLRKCCACQEFRSPSVQSQNAAPATLFVPQAAEVLHLSRKLMSRTALAAVPMGPVASLWRTREKRVAPEVVCASPEPAKHAQGAHFEQATLSLNLNTCHLFPLPVFSILLPLSLTFSLARRSPKSSPEKVLPSKQRSPVFPGFWF